jgi:PIN domain nuclease of toxin-antitoxin system
MPPSKTSPTTASAGYLLDTHAFLWLAADDDRLPARSRKLFLDPRSECFLSMASVWELAIKASLKKLTLDTSLQQLIEGGIEQGIRLLAIREDHAYLVQTLPFHHRDPFDRLLVAQAIRENLRLISRDDELDAYPVDRVWS